MDGHTRTTVRFCPLCCFGSHLLLCLESSCVHVCVRASHRSLIVVPLLACDYCLMDTTDGDGIQKFVPAGFCRRTRDHITTMMGWICEMWNGTAGACSCLPYVMPVTCNVSYYWNRKVSVNRYCTIPPITNNDN